MSSQSRTVFFTHNWGENNANHNHCHEIAQFLKNEGIPMWFDEDRMEGQIADAMVDGIDESDMLLIAVTATYMAKINSKNLADNCLREFNYAMDQPRFAGKFVCIVTDEDALDTHLWTGAFKMKVGNPLVINLCPSLRGEEREKNMRELATLLKRKLVPNGESGGESAVAMQKAFAQIVESKGAGNKARGGKVGFWPFFWKKTRLPISTNPALIKAVQEPFAQTENSKGGSIKAAQDAFAEMQMRPDVAWGADTSITIAQLTFLLDLAEVPKPREIASLLIEDRNDSLEKLSALSVNDLCDLQISPKNSKLIVDGIIAKLRRTESFEAELEAASEAKKVMFWVLMARNAQEAAAGCAAINRFLVNNNERDSKALFDLGCSEAIVAALQRYALDAYVVMCACLAIGSIPEEFSAEYKKLEEMGACEAVVAALQRFGVKNAKVAEYGCFAIRNLAGNDANCEKLGQISACEAVVAALQRFGEEDADVAEEGCFAIFMLATNDANREKLGQVGGCEAVVAAMQRLGAESAKVSENGCFTVGLLACGNANNMQKLGQVGACEAVVAALQRFGEENEDVAEQGCFAIGSLADNDANCGKLGEIGACEAVVAALLRFGAENVKMAESGCGAIRYLALNNSNQQNLGHLGACEAVVTALRRFWAVNAVTATEGCLAIGNLASNNANNRDKLGRIGACKAVVAALQHIGVEDWRGAQSGCWAIANLARNNANNCETLGEIGACEAVVAALKRFGAEMWIVAEPGCMAIGDLAYLNAKNREKLGKLRAIVVVSECLENDNKKKALAALK